MKSATEFIKQAATSGYISPKFIKPYLISWAERVLNAPIEWPSQPYDVGDMNQLEIVAVYQHAVAHRIVMSDVPDEPGFVRLEGWEGLSEWYEAALDGEPTPERITPAHTLTVDLATQTLTLDGTDYPVSSDLVLRWIKILAEHAGELIAGKELKDFDAALLSDRTDRLKKYLPQPVRDLIESKEGKGSRLRLGRRSAT